MRENDEFLLRVDNVTVLLDFAGETVPEDERPRFVCGEERIVTLFAGSGMGVGFSLVRGHFDDHTAAVGVGIGTHDEVHVIPRVAMFFFVGCDGDICCAPVAGVGLLFFAGVATEGWEHSVESVELHDAADVVETDFV